MQRDEKPVRLAFAAYRRYYEKGMCSKRIPTYDSFAKNSLYTAFVRFARYLMNISALNPQGYIDFLIKVDAPIAKWESSVYYETYVRELIKSELPFEALERNIMLMQQWAVETGEHWTDFFRKVAPAQATLWIKSGRISPWILLTASSAECLLERLSEEQNVIMIQSIEYGFWELKLSRHELDVETIKHELLKAGI